MLPSRGLKYLVQQLITMVHFIYLHFETYQQVLNQSLDVLRSLRGWRIVRCQLNKCGQEILTLLHILLHFL